MSQLPLDLTLRDEAMARAVDHADRVHEGWSDLAYAILMEFAASNHEFMAEDVRVFALDNPGYATPPDNRAWGAVIMIVGVLGLRGTKKTPWEGALVAEEATILPKQDIGNACFFRVPSQH